jgi:hypothetical protein
MAVKTSVAQTLVEHLHLMPGNQPRVCIYSIDRWHEDNNSSLCLNNSHDGTINCTIQSESNDIQNGYDLSAKDQNQPANVEATMMHSGDCQQAQGK